jgi:hypothetical protein
MPYYHNNIWSKFLLKQLATISNLFSTAKISLCLNMQLENKKVEEKSGK